MTGPGDNSIARDLLRSFVERIERLEEEQKAINDDKRDVYAEAKGQGFDTKVMKKIIADRRKDSAERQEFQTIYDLYAYALGMASNNIDVNVNQPEKLNDSSRAPARAGKPPLHAYQPARETTLTDVRQAWKDGTPISGDRAFQNGFVYFAVNSLTERIKVGLSNDPERRVDDLSRASGVRLEILHLVPGNRQCEIYAHEQLQKFRIEGEWFDFRSDEAKCAIEDVAQTLFGLATPEAKASDFPDPHKSEVDGGQPSPTPDQEAQKAGVIHAPVGQGCAEQGINIEQSGEQDAAESQAGNEAGSEEAATASNSDFPEMPAFLKRGNPVESAEV